jgi:hypothetical protein
MSGYGLLYAHFSENSTLGSSTKILEKSILHYFNPSPDSQALITRFASSGPREIIKIYSEKNEEEIDKLVFLPTYADISHYFTAFYNPTSGYLFSDITTHLLPCAHWFYSSSDRCIALRVIRI